MAAAVALAIPFNLVASAQYVRFSEKPIEPISVRLQGLEPEDMRRVIVCGDDIFDREVEFTVQDAVWTLPRIIPLKRLKLGFTVAGSRTASGSGYRYRRRRHPVQPRRDQDMEAPLRAKIWSTFLSGPPVGRRRAVFRDLEGVMNWEGNGEFCRAFAREAARLLAALATLLMALVFGLGRLADRWRLLRGPEWRPVCGTPSAWARSIFFIRSSPEAERRLLLRRPGGFHQGYGGIFDLGIVLWDPLLPRARKAAVLIFIAGTVVLFLLDVRVAAASEKDLPEPTGKRSRSSPSWRSSLSWSSRQRAVFRSPVPHGENGRLFCPALYSFSLFLLEGPRPSRRRLAAGGPPAPDGLRRALGVSWGAFGKPDAHQSVELRRRYETDDPGRRLPAGR